MKQLSALDAAFLGLENSTMTGNISSIMLLDPSGLDDEFDLAHITQFVAERLDRVIFFRKRLAEVPFGLDRSYWVDDDHFDLSYHVRESALPRPGTVEQLMELAARIHERPLDTSRPLWELYLVTGLADGRVALITKTHHVVIDGVSGMEVLSALVDLEPLQLTGKPFKFVPEPAPSSVGLLARSAIGMLQRPGDAWTVVTGLAKWTPAMLSLSALKPRNPLRQKDADPEIVTDSLPVRPPVTTFNGRISRRRRLGVIDLPLHDIKTVKNAFGTSVNDVVMAVMAGAVRRWLLQDGGVTGTPLVAMVPVAVRSADRSEQGNFVTAMLATLPTHLEDPKDRLRRSSKFTKSARKKGGAVPPTVLTSAMQFAPPVIFGRAARAMWETGIFRTIRPFNLIISNVPGGSRQAYVAGAELQAMYPLSVLADGIGLNITLLGYRDLLHVGITTDPELVPDPQQICEWAIEELALLVQEAERPASQAD